MSILKSAPVALPSRRLASLPPLSLYIHLPWCLRKCPYCDFNSHEVRGDMPWERYVDALVADLEAVLPLVWGRRVYTLFIGGGTPSLFPAESIDRLLGAVPNWLSPTSGSSPSSASSSATPWS